MCTLCVYYVCVPCMYCVCSVCSVCVVCEFTVCVYYLLDCTYRRSSSSYCVCTVCVYCVCTVCVLCVCTLCTCTLCVYSVVLDQHHRVQEHVGVFLTAHIASLLAVISHELPVFSSSTMFLPLWTFSVCVRALG